MSSRLSLLRTWLPRPQTRVFTTTHPHLSKPLPPRTPLADGDIIEKFLHGSGPGGQKINKTSSAVQLKHIPTGIVVKYQDTRSRTVNRKMARRILQERIEEAQLGEDARTKVKQREMSRKKQSADKKKRRKYRQLSKELAGYGDDVDDKNGVYIEDLMDGEDWVDGKDVVDAGKEVVQDQARKPEGG